MQVKTDKDQESRFQSLSRKECRACQCETRKAYVMAQEVVVSPPPIGRVVGAVGCPVCDDPPAVNVRNNTGQSHQRTISLRERWRRVGHGPTHKEMCDRVHLLPWHLTGTPTIPPSASSPPESLLPFTPGADYHG